MKFETEEEIKQTKIKQKLEPKYKESVPNGK